ncbi:zinc-dependent alcohol dehydrogenase family protein [Streptomyces thioluteus]|uniref:Zinc-dependent alcohol dehydrogenase family protein n=1 Tax=Streptomyces thioluteus TaxID=66431 RepID=A0ABP6JDP7_STRTU
MGARTVLFDGTGGPEVLRLAESDVAGPGPRAGEVRVRVEALGVGRADVLFRAGRSPCPPVLPGSRIGAEAAGVVVAVGPDVTECAAGDAVNLLATGDLSARGVHAECVTVPAHAVFRRPGGVDAVTGVAAWLPYLTAYDVLDRTGPLRPGEPVLITAASGGTGMAVVRTARLAGADPIAVTASGARKERLLRSGAAHAIALDEGDLVERVRELTGGRGVRLVLDTEGGGPGPARLAGAVARGGTLVVRGPAEPWSAQWPLNVLEFGPAAVLEDAERLRRAVAFVDAGLRSGALSPEVDRVLDGLESIAEAHRRVEEGRLGAVVVRVGGERG